MGGGVRGERERKLLHALTGPFSISCSQVSQNEHPHICLYFMKCEEFTKTKSNCLWLKTL